jgi:uncharacterized protein (TIGR03118 family)
MSKLGRTSMGLLAVVLLPAGMLCAGENAAYKQTNIVSDTMGFARVTDSNLANPRGVAFLAGHGFAVSDEKAGVATLYDLSGNIQRAASIPAAGGSSAFSTPTGVVANRTPGFMIDQEGARAASRFIFAAADGTISAWDGRSSTAVLTVDNSMAGAMYTGLALITNSSGSFLLAPDFRNGRIDVFDSNFQAARLEGDFADAMLPAGFVPFGVHSVSSEGVELVVVAYAKQDGARRFVVTGAGNGFVDLFDVNGNLLRRVASNGELNAPFGVALAPDGFGPFGGALLVGNFGDGTINAFNFGTGDLMGRLHDGNGNVITNASLGDLMFGQLAGSAPGALFFTAGLANGEHGLFGSISAVAMSQTTADFSIAASQSAITMTAGQSMNINVTVTSMNGFNAAVDLSCSGQIPQVSCTYSPASVMPASGGTATATLTISAAAATGTGNGGPYGMAVPLSGLALFSGVLVGAPGLRRRFGNAWLRRLIGPFALLVLLAALLVTSACGGYKAPAAQATSTTVMVTGTSGTLTHSASVTVTVN